MITAALQSLKNGDYPIITLEWRRMVRGKSRFRALLIAAAAISLVGLFGIFTQIAGARNGTTSYYGVLPAIGALVAVLLMLIQKIVLWLVIPLYTARAFASQVDSGALQMLAVTPMSSRFIVGQVAVVAVALALAIAAVTFPALTALWFYAADTGVGMSMLPYVGEPMTQAWFPATAALYAAVGLYCSCAFPRGQSATFMTYALIILVDCVLLRALWYAPLLMLFRTFMPWQMMAMNRAMSPLTTFAQITSLGCAGLFLFKAVQRFDRMRRGRGGAGW